MEIHEAANIFPMEEETLESLAADIREHGQAKSIELYTGKVIDGRRRLRACESVGIKPKFVDVTDKVSDPVAYVLSLNLHRRQLTPSQKAMVAARVREMYDQAAKERQKAHSGTAPGKGKTLVENFPQVNDGAKARDAAGKAVGVNGKYVDHATKVLTKAIPEVVKAVEEGRMNVTTAAVLATEPPETQLDEVNQPKRNRKYKSGPNGSEPEPIEDPEQTKEQNAAKGGPVKLLGVGVIRAREAIGVLSQIPLNDPLRKDGFKIVKDWLKREEK